MNELNNSWYAIINPQAGSGKTISKWREMEAMLFEKNLSYKFVTPDSRHDAKMRIRAACERGYRKFIAVGGDGTVHNVLRHLTEYALSHDDVKLEDFSLAALPIGSGNDWLKSHNIPNDVHAIIELISKGSFSPQDVVSAEIMDRDRTKVLTSVYMANVGGYALDAEICDHVNFQKANGIRGKVMYYKALLKLALGTKPQVATVLIDGKKFFEGKIFSLSIGNGRYSGGGMQQTPSAVIDDGLIDIMIAPTFPFIKFYGALPKIASGKLEQIDFLHFSKGSVIEIIPENQGQLVEVDGEVVGRAPVRFTVLPHRIKVLHQDR